jgi:hypothetical protein
METLSTTSVLTLGPTTQEEAVAFRNLLVSEFKDSDQQTTIQAMVYMRWVINNALRDLNIQDKASQIQLPI